MPRWHLVTALFSFEAKGKLHCSQQSEGHIASRIAPRPTNHGQPATICALAQLCESTCASLQFKTATQCTWLPFWYLLAGSCGVEWGWCPDPCFVPAPSCLPDAFVLFAARYRTLVGSLASCCRHCRHCRHCRQQPFADVSQLLSAHHSRLTALMKVRASIKVRSAVWYALLISVGD